MLAREGRCLWFWGWHGDLAFVGDLDTITKWPCFVSLDHGDFVWGWYPVRLFMPNRRITWQSCECQASFWGSGAAFVPPFSPFLHVGEMPAYNSVLLHHMYRFVEPPPQSRNKTTLSPQRCLLCYPFIVTPCLLPTIPYPWQPLIYFTSLKHHHFENALQMESFTTYVTFWYWLFPLSIMPLRSTQVVMYSNSAFLFHCSVVFHGMCISFRLLL